MFLLRSEGGVAIENNCLFSKFHYVSIKMANDMMSFSNYKHSKFHYVSIKMGTAMVDIQNAYHSKFHYVSIKIGTMLNLCVLMFSLNSTMFLLR